MGLNMPRPIFMEGTSLTVGDIGAGLNRSASPNVEEFAQILQGTVESEKLGSSSGNATVISDNFDDDIDGGGNGIIANRAVGAEPFQNDGLRDSGNRAFDAEAIPVSELKAGWMRR